MSEKETIKTSGPGWTTENDGDFLIIAVDLKSNLGLTGSGKNLAVAKCEGGKACVGHDMVMGLNVYTKPTT